MDELKERIAALEVMVAHLAQHAGLRCAIKGCTDLVTHICVDCERPMCSYHMRDHDVCKECDDERLMRQ